MKENRERILKIRDLNISFKTTGGKVHAVRGVNLDLYKGETIAIVGESGSGKSTLAKLITRLTDITEGTLKFEGKDITNLKRSQLKEVYGNIQMVSRTLWVPLIQERHLDMESVRAFATVM